MGVGGRSQLLFWGSSAHTACKRPTRLSIRGGGEKRRPKNRGIRDCLAFTWGLLVLTSQKTNTEAPGRFLQSRKRVKRTGKGASTVWGGPGGSERRRVYARGTVHGLREIKKLGGEGKPSTEGKECAMRKMKQGAAFGQWPAEVKRTAIVKEKGWGLNVSHRAIVKKGELRFRAWMRKDKNEAKNRHKRGEADRSSREKAFSEGLGPRIGFYRSGRKKRRWKCRRQKKKERDGLE